MKYYLGKLKNAKYEPIKCIEEDDILSVINYTSKFYDEEELRTELINRKLIDGNEPLVYVYRQKDKYLKLNNGENLTFSYAKEYNTSNGLYQTLVREKYNQDLYTFLSKMIVRKYSGVKNHIAERENILEVYREVLYANQIGLEAYEESNDKKRLNEMILKFLKSAIGEYDKKLKQYKMSNGKLDWNKRKLVDLVLLLNAFYNEKIRETIYAIIDDEEPKPKEPASQFEEPEEDEKEEFLTEEDFENYGYNPDEFKKLIREPKRY